MLLETVELEQLNNAEVLLDAEVLEVFGGTPTNGRYEAKLANFAHFTCKNVIYYKK